MTTVDTDRSRTYTWADPLETVAAGRDLSGLEFLRSLLAGAAPRPPIADTLGFDLVEVDEGRAVFEVVPQEFHYNPIGVVHGGLAMTLLDSALGCAVHSTLPAGAIYTTLETKVNMTRAITAATGPLRCEASTIHVGRRVATAEGRLVDAAGRIYAHGTTTCFIDRS
jgi:uncharacterized protein (TIGR00369 family)